MDSVKNKYRVLVTGGGGFVGLALLRKLMEQGHKLASFSRHCYPEHKKWGVTSIQGDLKNQEDVNRACQRQDVVFHSAAKVGVWGRKSDFYETNVTGTKHIIRACMANHVKVLIFTSSASVVFDGKDIQGANESLEYPSRPLSWYAGSKAEAEKLVLQAHSPQLRTLSLRPHLIWGPGDTQLIPSILERAATGKLRRPGKKNCLVDTTYISNCVDAHIRALQVMNSDRIGGKAFFIGNNEPVPVWNFINGILSAHSYPPINSVVPKRIAMAFAFIMEKTHQLPFIQSEPSLTRFVIQELNTHHWFDLSRAHDLLGYEARIGFEEGMNILRAYHS